MNEENIKRFRVLVDVSNERRRQEQLVEDGKFPWTCANLLAPDAYKLAVLVEEVGEVATALVVDQSNLRLELIQVAAVAVAWAEALTSEEE